MEKIIDGRFDDRDRIDSAMPVEASVFGREGFLDNGRWDLIESRPILNALISWIEGADDIAVAIEKGPGLGRTVVMRGIKQQGTDDHQRDCERKKEPLHEKQKPISDREKDNTSLYVWRIN